MKKETAVEWQSLRFKELMYQYFNSDMRFNKFIDQIAAIEVTANEITKRQLFEARMDMQKKCVKIANDTIEKMGLLPMFTVNPDDDYYEQNFEN